MQYMDKNTKKQFKAAWVALKYLVPATAVVINGETIAETGKRLQKKAVLRLFELTGSGDAAIAALKSTTWNVTLKRQVGFDLLYQSGGVNGLTFATGCCAPCPDSTEPVVVHGVTSV